MYGEEPDLLVPSRILGSTTDDISDFLFDLDLPTDTTVQGGTGTWPRPLPSMGALIAVLSGAVRGCESARVLKNVQSELTEAERRALSGLELGPSAPLLRAGAALRLELANALATQPGQGPDRALSEAKVDRFALTRLLDVASGVVEQLASAQDQEIPSAMFAAIRSALVRDMAPLVKLRGHVGHIVLRPQAPAVEPSKPRKKHRAFSASKVFMAVGALCAMGFVAVPAAEGVELAWIESQRERSIRALEEALFERFSAPERMSGAFVASWNPSFPPVGQARAPKVDDAWAGLELPKAAHHSYMVVGSREAGSSTFSIYAAGDLDGDGEIGLRYRAWRHDGETWRLMADVMPQGTR